MPARFGGTTSPGWDQARLLTLRIMADKGHSAREIAETIGHGMTRNAVIGKALRLNIRLQGNAGRPNPTPVVVEPVSNPAKRWGPEREDVLRNLFAQGLSLKRIASEMRADRRKVREKIGTLGLVRVAPPACKPPLAQPVKASIASLVAKEAKAKPPKLLPPAVDPIESLFAPPEVEPVRRSGGVTIADLRAFDCRWISGPACGADTLYCGGPCAAGSSYCSDHSAIATRSPRPSKATAGLHPRQFPRLLALKTEPIGEPL